MNKITGIIILLGISISSTKCSNKISGNVSDTKSPFVDKFLLCTVSSNSERDTMVCVQEASKEILISKLSANQIGLEFHSSGVYEQIATRKDLNGRSPSRGTWTKSKDSLVIKYDNVGMTMGLKLLSHENSVFIFKMFASQ